MYYLYGNSGWYIDCCPLYGRYPLLGVSVIGGSTVYIYRTSSLLVPGGPPVNALRGNVRPAA